MLTVALSCKGEGEGHTATHNHITSMKKPGGERLLIVSPFHRLEAVRALCGSGSQWRTQALVHEKIQCIKQVGLKGKAARGYKLLFHVLLSLSLCMSYSLCQRGLLFLLILLRLLYSVSLSPQRFLLDQANDTLSFFNSLIWQFF